MLVSRNKCGSCARICAVAVILLVAGLLWLILPEHASAQDGAGLVQRVFLPQITSPAPRLSPPPGTGWLPYVNYYRALARLNPVVQNDAWG